MLYEASLRLVGKLKTIRRGQTPLIMFQACPTMRILVYYRHRTTHEFFYRPFSIRNSFVLSCCAVRVLASTSTQLDSNNTTPVFMQNGTLLSIHSDTTSASACFVPSCSLSLGLPRSWNYSITVPQRTWTNLTTLPPSPGGCNKTTATGFTNDTFIVCYPQANRTAQMEPSGVIGPEPQNATSTLLTATAVAPGSRVFDDLDVPNAFGSASHKTPVFLSGLITLLCLCLSLIIT